MKLYWRKSLAPSAAPRMAEDRKVGSLPLITSKYHKSQTLSYHTIPWWPHPLPTPPPSILSSSSRQLPCSFQFSSLFSPHWHANRTRAVLLFKNNKMFYTYFCIYNWTTFYMSLLHSKRYKTSSSENTVMYKKKDVKSTSQQCKNILHSIMEWDLLSRRKVCF